MNAVLAQVLAVMTPADLVALVNGVCGAELLARRRARRTAGRG